jgi:hypothetical protein
MVATVEPRDSTPLIWLLASWKTSDVSSIVKNAELGSTVNDHVLVATLSIGNKVYGTETMVTLNTIDIMETVLDSLLTDCSLND